MKTHLKHLLGLVLTVLIISGCQNPSGPEIPEDMDNLTKVEFKWATCPEVGSWIGSFEGHSPMYLSGLYYDSELNDYAYGLPEGWDWSDYVELFKDKERFKKFSDDAFEKVFGTKYYEEGTVIDLTKWTYRAIRLTDKKFADCLQFSLNDKTSEFGYVENSFDQIVVGNENIVVYVFWDSGDSKYSEFYGL